MSTPYYNDDRTRDQRRDWIRGFLPSGREGFVCEDLDAVARVFFPITEDATGKFMLCEFRWNYGSIKNSKHRTFGLLDSLLRKAPDYEKRYVGFYIINWPGDRVGDTTMINFQVSPEINGVQLSWTELKDFFLFKHCVPPYSFR